MSLKNSGGILVPNPKIILPGGLGGLGGGGGAGGLGLPMHAQTLYRMRYFDHHKNLIWEDGFHNRVMTSGLNQLLDATLKTGVTSPTWFVFLIGAVASDGAITSGAAVLTSASNPFSASDVGRSIIVRGAGASGADLSTTISAFTNSGSVTLAANAGTTVTGAKFAFDGRSASTMSSHADWVESTAYSNSTRPAFTPGTIASGSVDNSASPAVFNINATDYIFGAGMANNSTKGGTTGILYGTGINGSGIANQVTSGGTLNVTVTPSITG